MRLDETLVSTNTAWPGLKVMEIAEKNIGINPTHIDSSRAQRTSRHMARSKPTFDDLADSLGKYPWWAYLATALIGVMLARGASAGVLVSIGMFTNKALRQAAWLNIELLGGDDLLRRGRRVRSGVGATG